MASVSSNVPAGGTPQREGDARAAATGAQAQQPQTPQRNTQAQQQHAQAAQRRSLTVADEHRNEIASKLFSDASKNKDTTGAYMQHLLQVTTMLRDTPDRATIAAETVHYTKKFMESAETADEVGMAHNLCHSLAHGHKLFPDSTKALAEIDVLHVARFRELEKAAKMAAAQAASVKPVDHMAEILKLQQMRQTFQDHPGAEALHRLLEGPYAGEANLAELGTLIVKLCENGSLEEKELMWIILLMLVADGTLDKRLAMHYVFEFCGNGTHNHDHFNAIVLKDHPIALDTAVEEAKEVTIARCPSVKDHGFTHVARFLNAAATKYRNGLEQETQPDYYVEGGNARKIPSAYPRPKQAATRKMDVLTAGGGAINAGRFVADAIREFAGDIGPIYAGAVFDPPKTQKEIEPVYVELWDAQNQGGTPSAMINLTQICQALHDMDRNVGSVKALVKSIASSIKRTGGGGGGGGGQSRRNRGARGGGGNRGPYLPSTNSLVSSGTQPHQQNTAAPAGFP